MTKLKINCVGTVPTPRSKLNPANKSYVAAGKPHIVGTTLGYRSKIAAPIKQTKI